MGTRRPCELVIRDCNRRTSRRPAPAGEPGGRTTAITHGMMNNLSITAGASVANRRRAA
jgi:hypothetical protein